MSLKGLELDYSVQGTDEQKSLMNTNFIGFASGVTRFVALSGGVDGGSEAQHTNQMSRKGRVKKILLNIITNSVDGVATVTLRKNIANSVPLLEFTVPATNSVNQEIILDVEFDISDLLGFKVVTLGGLGTFSIRLATEIAMEAS